MNILSYPLRYLALEAEAGNKLYKRDVIFVIGMATVLSLPFIVLDGNFFGSGGFLDRIGSFASVLTGFYIAALVGVASLTSTFGGLDEVIEDGPILAPSSSNESIPLTRRQYVCSLFGYLAFVSLFVSVSAILAVVCSAVITPELMVKWQAHIAGLLNRNADFVPTTLEAIRAAMIIFYAIVISHIVATTCHGLYYYIDRIYAAKTEMGTKPQLVDNEAAYVAAAERLNS